MIRRSPLPKITHDGSSIFPKTKRQGLELTGIYLSAIAAVIASPQITWPQVAAIIALCFFGHTASTKGNR